MTSHDVRDILNVSNSLPSTSQQTSSTFRKQPLAIHKRPDGISRELYALIGDNAPSLAQAQASLSALKYRERPKQKTQRVKWEQVAFTPHQGQQPAVPLKRWAKLNEGDNESKTQYFAGFSSTGPSIMEYSQFEYEQHLRDPDWTPQETSYLFELLRKYDLRFVVAADRYEYNGNKDGPPIKRSIETIKDRYYTICRRLVRTRTATDPQLQQQMLQSYSFDKAREIKRKQYASELFHLTAGEIAEEEALYMEIKRMEQNERRYRVDRDDLMRVMIGFDSGLVSLEQARGEGVLGMDKNKKRKRLDETDLPRPVPVAPVIPTKKHRDSIAFDQKHNIYRLPEALGTSTTPAATRHPVHAVVHLRSSKLATPKSSALIRITELLTQMGISSQKLVMPTRENLEIYDQLLSALGALVDIKRLVDRVEQEERTLRAQKEGFIPPQDSTRQVVSTTRGELMSSLDPTL